jgi:hypothetical protein
MAAIVIASAAKQSIATRQEWIASLALAMTGNWI